MLDAKVKYMNTGWLCLEEPQAHPYTFDALMRIIAVFPDTPQSSMSWANCTHGESDICRLTTITNALDCVHDDYIIMQHLACKCLRCQSLCLLDADSRTQVTVDASHELSA